MVTPCSAAVVSVGNKSAAARCGLRAGDCLLSINALPLRDAIDVQVYGGEPEITLEFERAGRQRTCTVRRRYGEPLGLEFADVIFDGQPRVCRNNCDFCFVGQMAPGLRAPLYVRDDDYRLSFLHGNYITLTNLEAADWERIEAQVLSPLYVSVHATEPDVRVGLMRNPRAGDIVTQLRRLVEMGIVMHTQAVLVPGRNDGIHLDRTIADLASLYPAVRDVSVVPVGLTRWHNPCLEIYTDAEVLRVLRQLQAWQLQLRDELGVGFVYPSDEWFLRADVAVPQVDAYDGLLPEMVENGVGTVRLFMDSRKALTAALVEVGRRQTWVTGILFASTLTTFARDFERETGVLVEVTPVANRYFGETVTVTGLLTGQDIVAALREQDSDSALVLPGEIFRGPERQSLDGMTAQAIGVETGRPVFVATRRDHGITEVEWSIDPVG